MENKIDEGIMVKAKKSRADYIRNWRRKNPDKVKQYNLNYWVKKAQQEQAVSDAE